MSLLVLLSAGAPCLTAGDLVSRQGRVLAGNELSVGYGRGSYAELGLAVTGALGVAFTLGAAQLEELSSAGVFFVEYKRNVLRSLALGVAMGYEGCTLRFKTAGSDGPGTGRYSFLTLMPSATLRWFSFRRVGMYSRAAAGIMLSVGNGSAKPVFAFQAGLVCVDFGGDTLRGFIELGGGCQGLVSGGLRYCF